MMAHGDIIDMPLTAEDAIIMQELEWAEKTMESYRQKNGKIPIRSPIRAIHVNSQEWRQDSIDVVSSMRDFIVEEQVGSNYNLRGSRSTDAFSR